MNRVSDFFYLMNAPLVGLILIKNKYFSLINGFYVTFISWNAVIDFKALCTYIKFQVINIQYK